MTPVLMISSFKREARSRPALVSINVGPSIPKGIIFCSSITTDYTNIKMYNLINKARFCSDTFGHCFHINRSSFFYRRHKFIDIFMHTSSVCGAIVCDKLLYTTPKMSLCIGDIFETLEYHRSMGGVFAEFSS
jgi:hypothetical protein